MLSLPQCWSQSLPTVPGRSFPKFPSMKFDEPLRSCRTQHWSPALWLSLTVPSGTNLHAEFRARVQEASQGNKLRQSMGHINCRARCPAASLAGREQPQNEKHQAACRAHLGSDRKHLVEVGVCWHQRNCVLRQLACTVWSSGQSCARSSL